MTQRAGTTRRPKSADAALRRVWAMRGAVVLAVLLAVGLPLANMYWPYRYRNVKPLLESVLASQLTIAKYHRTYFPRPGFVASGLTLRRNTAQNLAPVGSAKDLIVQGSWLDLLMLRDRVQLVAIVGLKVVIPPVGSQANREDFPPGSSTDFAGPTTAVETLHLRDAELDIQRVHGGEYVFPIRDLVIRNLQKGQTITYAVDMQNPMPTGRIVSEGSFGPLMPQNLGGTKLHGNFTFAPVNLSDLGGIRGTLSAKGTFGGTLEDVAVKAESDVPDFGVNDGRSTGVTGRVQATVNGLNGNVVLQRVEAKVGATTIQTAGDIASSPGMPKATRLTVAVEGGRLQDVLRPFFQKKVPVTGFLSLHNRVRIDGAQGDASFWKRLHVEGRFDVPQQMLTNKANEQKLSAFSERAQGAKQADADGDVDVVSSLRGDVAIRDGVFSTDDLMFALPGADADLKGTYDFKSSTVHMTGQLRMQTDISHVTTGFKSMLLKPLIPFTKKKHAGAVVPIAITGSKGHYTVGQDFLHDK